MPFEAYNHTLHGPTKQFRKEFHLWLLDWFRISKKKKLVYGAFGVKYQETIPIPSTHTYFVSSTE
jgi:hypothetical protein